MGIKIPIYKPFLPPESLKYAHDALDSTWISSQGKYLNMVEEKLKEFLNVDYVLPTNNGTTACHLVAKALKFYNNKIYNVIVPNNVYVAAWNSFIFDKGDFNLIPVDANEKTWLMDYHEFEKVAKDADAVLVVHNLGNIINVPLLKKAYRKLVFVEDNCEGFGGKYLSYKSGTQSLCSSLSFFANKTVTSGEGGAFITNNKDLYEFAKKTHGQGMSKTKYVHDILGYNYRMTNIQAAILYGQLEIYPKIKDRKDAIWEYYDFMFYDDPFISTQMISNKTRHAQWMYGLRIKNNPSYEELKNYFEERGIETRQMFFPISSHEHLKQYAGKEDIANLLNREVFMIPCYPELTTKEQCEVVDAVRCYSQKINGVKKY